MKVLSVLSLVTAATALPVHANIKVVTLDKEGNKQIEEIPNVELDDYKSLQELAAAVRDHTLKTDERTESNDVEQVAPLSTYLESEKEHIKSFFEKSYAAFAKAFGTADAQEAQKLDEIKGTEPHAIKNIRCKNKPHGRPHGKHHGKPKFRHWGNGGHRGHRNKFHKIITSEEAEKLKAEGVDLVKGHYITHEQIEEFAKKHGISTERFYKHYKHHGGKFSEASSEPSKLDTVKQFSNGFYQDVKSFDYQGSFRQIYENPDASSRICAGATIGAGVGFLIFNMIVLVHVVRSVRARRTAKNANTDDEALPSYKEHEDDVEEEEQALLSEKH